MGFFFLLYFQAFSLRDMKWRQEKAAAFGQKMSYRFSFC